MRHPQIMMNGTSEHTLRWMRRSMDRSSEMPPCSLHAANLLGLSSSSVGRANDLEIPYALSQMVDAPIFWELEEATALALMRTDPGAPDLRGFRLPFPSIWVGMPPLFELQDRQTGGHKIEGFYLVEDWIPNRYKLYEKAGIPDSRKMSSLTETELRSLEVEFLRDVVLYRSVLVIAVGESKNGVVKTQFSTLSGGRRTTFEGVERNDTLLSFWIFTEDPDRELIVAKNHGEDVLTRLTVNLLMALQEKYLSKQTVVPRRPKSLKKVKRALRRGQTFDPFTVLRLAPSTRTSSGGGGGGGPTKDRVIGGYWQHLWVKAENIGERRVLAERQGKVSLLHKIRVWVRPNVIGNPTSRTTLVKE
jgi:hypothetical protein